MPPENVRKPNGLNTAGEDDIVFIEAEKEKELIITKWVFLKIS